MGIIRKKNLEAKQTLHDVTIQSVKKLADDVLILSFKRELEFDAGQVLAITVSEKIEPRLYSIASGENDPEVEILYKITPDGLLTPKLAQLKPGNKIQVSEPFGVFTDYSQPASWIATGTGIAPFRSMLRSGKADSQTHVIYGGRDADSFYFSNEFSVLGERFIPCSSTYTIPGFYPGRLTKYLNEKKQFRPNEKFLLCGSAEMVVSVRDILINKGINFEQIVAEIYF